MTIAAQSTGAEDVAWDLSDLYAHPDDPKLDADVRDALEAARRFNERYHGGVGGLDAGELAAAVAEMERIAGSLTRVAAYAHLMFATDTADPKRGALLQRVQEEATQAQTQLLFFELEWLAIDDAKAGELLEHASVSHYRHFLEASRRYKPYVLTEPEEKILTEKSVSGSSAWGRLFEELAAAIHVKIDGEDASLEEALALLQQADGDLRRRAAEAVTDALQEGLRTRGFIFNTLIHDKATDDRLRDYPNWIASRNLSNEASDESVQALIDAVVARYDIPHRYYALKARLLGVDMIKDYDRMAPVGEARAISSWDEARELIVASYRDFSPSAGEVIEGFFSRNWIDAPVRPNKAPGAFCATTIPGVHPYVFMNYTGERRSVLTLAHELGHGLHGVLAQEQGLFNADTTLTMAETASVFGESLTFRRLLSGEDDPRERLALLIGRLDDTIATVFRQVAMNRFEDAVHNARRTQGELSLDDLSRLWVDSQSALLGDAVQITDGYRIWWSYIPHFFRSPGYVYAYAFGYLFSLAIFRKYVREGEPMVGPYMKLLAAGGSDSPEKLAGLVGLDLGDPGFWAEGLDAIDEVLNEAESLAEQLS